MRYKQGNRGTGPKKKMTVGGGKKRKQEVQEQQPKKKKEKRKGFVYKYTHAYLRGTVWCVSFVLVG